MLQTAIGPVILISGNGLLLLSMTNRFGRVIDRSRQLSAALRDAAPQERWRLLAQIEILFKRAHRVRLAITWGALSVLLAAILIIALFCTALFALEAAVLLVALFIGCMVLLIGSVVYFLADLNLSLAALKLELQPSEGHPSEPALPARAGPGSDAARP